MGKRTTEKADYNGWIVDSICILLLFFLHFGIYDFLSSFRFYAFNIFPSSLFLFHIISTVVLSSKFSSFFNGIVQIIALSLSHFCFFSSYENKIKIANN